MTQTPISSLKCPKCGYERRAGDATKDDICPACGLVFAKWAQRVLGTDRVPSRDATEAAAESERQGFLQRLTDVEARTDPIIFWGRCALYAAFFVWGWYFILLDFRTNEIGDSFMHRVNLVFHEAGHVIFMPLGTFMSTLGGSLGQILMPLIAAGALAFKNRDNFGASLGLWWCGQSVMDLAPYINDARDLKLMLLGGGTGRDRPGIHDWENILLDLGWIQYDRQIAAVTDALGTLIVLVALSWGGYVLYRQYRNLPGQV